MPSGASRAGEWGGGGGGGESAKVVCTAQTVQPGGQCGNSRFVCMECADMEDIKG